MDERVYVQFEDVIKALREGKSATYIDGDTKITIGIRGCMDWTSRFSWLKLIEGKWIIND